MPKPDAPRPGTRARATAPARKPVAAKRTSKPIVMRRQPSQDRAHATIDAVLKAAEQEIAEGGLDRLTTKRIAATAGLSVGAVYEYFPNKETIIGELVQRWLDRVFDELDGVHPRHGAGLDVLSYVLEQTRLAQRLYHDQPGLGALLDMLMAMPALRAVVEVHDARMTESVSSALAFYMPQAAAEDLHTTALSIRIIAHEMIAAAVVYRSGDEQRLMTQLRVCLVALVSRLLAPA
ncbi:TetR/AcrR family transcriptional regulator [uncultured Aquincola sp.]|uniref:TetR/AcrR family transcriptional regulator n=1 Tax=uncultured Aquincola sp. TaxID=886556 RepID=UPI0032B19345|tara:strand:+ start:199 stop:903 length:705 start_codon:yes stop_codon:yes gene_type:complete